MLNTNVFNMANVMDKAADAAFLRHEAISNNIANNTTPGYKRQDVTFEKEFKKALVNSKFKTVGEKVNNLAMDDIEIRTYKDYNGFSYRLDGNNVDIDTENAMLAKNQIKYSGLVDSINGEFNSLKMVMK